MDSLPILVELNTSLRNYRLYTPPEERDRFLAWYRSFNPDPEDTFTTQFFDEEDGRIIVWSLYLKRKSIRKVLDRKGNIYEETTRKNRETEGSY